MKKPNKKNDKELFTLIKEKINQGLYIFVPHAKLRLKQRNISQLDVINILKGERECKRKRNKAKDSYEESISVIDKVQDWKYCIEGKDVDNNNIRIILTFNDDLMPIITVIKT